MRIKAIHSLAGTESVEIQPLVLPYSAGSLMIGVD